MKHSKIELVGAIYYVYRFVMEIVLVEFSSL